MADVYSNRCSAVIPLTNTNGIECNGPASVLTEAGWRCSECFSAFGGNRVTDLGSLMTLVINNLPGGSL